MRTRILLFGSFLAISLIPQVSLAAPPARSPLQTIELLHQAFHNVDCATLDSLPHPDYRGISLEVPGHLNDKNAIVYKNSPIG